MSNADGFVATDRNPIDSRSAVKTTQAIACIATAAAETVVDPLYSRTCVAQMRMPLQKARPISADSAIQTLIFAYMSQDLDLWACSVPLGFSLVEDGLFEEAMID